MGTALTFTAWSFFRVIGAAFNPCVALTLFLVGALKPLRFALYCIAHLLAGIAACAVLAGIMPGNLAIACRLGNGTSVVRGLFIEMFLTCFLCFTVCLTAIERHRATHICAIAIGLALFSTQLFALKLTGAAVNTARALGAAVLTDFDGYHWIYWLGPALGAVLAAGMYKLLLFAHFWEWQEHEDEVPASQAVRYAFSDITREQKLSAPVTIERV
ncbi:aquaporin-like protein [Cystobasidium minutum MCA 4210]|uniref:aquaporin-like protein n=1 Tax=Cystobasidium minutum MCA 4210 TaxID=1397322 RepID=UPI0034CDCCC1|eukprot:jgi/Rhomi1/169039/fgenesh1_kg.3_\